VLLGSNLRVVALSLAAVAASVACKPAPTGGATRLAQAPGQDGAGDALSCDCARLVPLAARPQWARIVRTTVQGASCAYAPAGVSNVSSAGLTVSVVAGEAAAVGAVDRWLKQVLATYPLVREQRAVPLSAGEATLAVGQGGAGEELVVAARVGTGDAARAAVAIADGETPDGAEGGVPAWLGAIAESVANACAPVP
jgi:hypothetical protein